MLPNLTKYLENKLIAMNDWCNSQLALEEKLTYLSLDIRNAGFKIAPVDANFFPAGFNLLSEVNKKKATEIIKSQYTEKKILLIAEDHTRNSHYLNNILALKTIFAKAGNTVKIANFLSPLENEAINSRLENNDFGGLGIITKIHSLTKQNNKLLTLEGFLPEIIILNNDLISNIPEPLLNLEQPCTPDPRLGWCNRHKMDYFLHYNKIVEEFSCYFDTDPWLFSTIIEKCSNVDFQKSQNLEALAEGVETTLHKTAAKYKEYNIIEKPYVFIKASKGSYGLGVISVDSASQVLNMNKILRKKMQVTKGRTPITEVIIQEGLKTIENYHGSPAEPMVYSLYNEIIGYIWRYNTLNDSSSNLNSKGMHFIDYTEQLIHNTDSNDSNKKVLDIAIKLSIIAGTREAQAILSS